MAFVIRNSKEPITKHQELDDTEETLAIADDQITSLQNQMLDLNMEDVQAQQSQEKRTQKKFTENKVLNDQTRAKFNKKKMNARKETNFSGKNGSLNDCYEDFSSNYSLECEEPCYNYQSARFGKYPSRRNDWICVQTERHPEIDKPKLYGKITQFKDLFTRQFQFHKLFNPDSEGQVNSATKHVQVTPFDGRNIEYFRQFEQGMLLKVINNDAMDFQTKFHFLLEYTSGPALWIVQIYTDVLNMSNFVQALEDLYYTYGNPIHLRDALIHQLLEEPVDVRKPESLQNTSALIKRILKTFEVDPAKDQLTSHLILENIKMTEETRRDYKLWIISGNREKNLTSLTQWLNFMYEYSVTESITEKYTKSSKLSNPPILMAKKKEQF